MLAAHLASELASSSESSEDKLSESSDHDKSEPWSTSKSRLSSAAARACCSTGETPGSSESDRFGSVPRFAAAGLS
ncbi:ORF005 [Saltwater crocodilepox virus]|nr:ORF005 [Saltwater crocodilepox virus]QGT48801.1 ORF005 [Saltwater crocodilepox virus]QGT49014.1 ORF005 [Saltwater crocodilepox virus]